MSYDVHVRFLTYLRSGDLLDDSLFPLSEISVHPRVKLLVKEEIRNGRTEMQKNTWARLRETSTQQGASHET